MQDRRPGPGTGSRGREADRTGIVRSCPVLQVNVMMVLSEDDDLIDDDDD